MAAGKNIAEARKAKGREWTQKKLAAELGVSPLEVRRWEHGELMPGIMHLNALSRILGVSLDDLLPDTVHGFVLKSPYIHPGWMYTYVEEKARAAGLEQTLAALPLMREKHAGETRIGRVVPFYVHPLTMACHALMMGITDDDVIAAALLHDVVEHTDTVPGELPVGDRVREAVCLLSYNTYGGEEDRERNRPLYFTNIAKNPLAALVKCLEQCSNLSTMADGFTTQEMVEYVKQTEKFVLPLHGVVKVVPEWEGVAWLLYYQMRTMLEAFKRLL